MALFTFWGGRGGLFIVADRCMYMYMFQQVHVEVGQWPTLGIIPWVLFL